MNPVIINLATAHHIKGQQRLQRSIQQFSPNIPFLSWTNEAQIQAPPHRSNPYAFKVYAFYKAIAAGYDTIFWMDASCYLIKDVNPLFEMIDKEGYWMEDAAHVVGRWLNAPARQYFKIPDEELNSMVMFMAGCFGLSGFNQTAMIFLDEWRITMEAGMFKGEWSDHRHDMSCGSIVANKLGMNLQPNAFYTRYAAPETPVDENVLIKLQGIC